MSPTGGVGAASSASASAWLHQSVGRLSDAVVAAFGAVPWYTRLSAHSRSWVRLVVHQEIATMAQSLVSAQAPSLHTVFSGVPGDVARQISLDQTVELLQLTVDVVLRVVDEVADEELDTAASAVLRGALERYGREVAFHAAAVYAKAAESRGRAAARHRALLIEALVDGFEEQIVARAADLVPVGVPVRILGMSPPPDAAPALLDEVARIAGRTGATVCGAAHGKTVLLVSVEDGPPTAPQPAGSQPAPHQPAAGEATTPVDLLTELRSLVGGVAGPGVVASEVISSVARAGPAAAAVLSGLQALAAWPGNPAIVSTEDLLVERVLCGDTEAARRLVAACVDPLVSAGHGLVETVDAMLRSDGSPEAAARSLPVHVNTLRYRIAKIIALTGRDPRRYRDASALQIAFTLARAGVISSALSH
ncbi:PucR C-terminal helix-turn-helix domain-containing protein [Frankia sp. EI5c]|uniref:helix-turn-helix domain-containing protein n=1 Tax=Frankia sp. EI5c TaxID=683316 RepID=UPI0007C396DF|nr:helix-turn-helix domain-containing protein [Frankia sp. EI5c]OAA27722.1 PucR C-terminal helix-turn-helix domain-containing protein [Frankia sp. EI5c]